MPDVDGWFSRRHSLRIRPFASHAAFFRHDTRGNRIGVSSLCLRSFLIFTQCGSSLWVIAQCIVPYLGSAEFALFILLLPVHYFSLYSSIFRQVLGEIVTLFPH